jgi:hypothetical protein
VKEGDHIMLLALQPSEQRREEDLERNHGLSLRQCIRPSFRTLRRRAGWVLLQALRISW